MAIRFRVKGASPAVLALLTLPLLAACSSKNPDALTTVNIDQPPADENLAEDSDGTVNADSNAAMARFPQAAGNGATGSAQANIDAAVNSLHEDDAEENSAHDAEADATGEDDDPVSN